MERPSFDILTGRNPALITHSPSIKRPIHQDVVGPLEQLRKAAAKEGFELEVVSGYRDYAQQLKIWNNKAAGKRSLLDEDGIPMDYATLSDNEIVEAILSWSAIPGASRHHWGTDIDVIDKAALPSEDYQVELVPAEVDDNGIFGPLHQWLDEQMAKDEAFGFFRPYENYTGGVRPERWHLSYGPISREYLKEFTLELFLKNIEMSDMALKNIVLDRAEEFYNKYVLNNP